MLGCCIYIKQIVAILSSLMINVKPCGCKNLLENIFLSDTIWYILTLQANATPSILNPKTEDLSETHKCYSLLTLDMKLARLLPLSLLTSTPSNIAEYNECPLAHSVEHSFYNPKVIRFDPRSPSTQLTYAWKIWSVRVLTCHNCISR